MPTSRRSKRLLVLRLRAHRFDREMVRLSKNLEIMEAVEGDRSPDYKHLTALFHEASRGFADARHELSVLQASYTDYACETKSERPADGHARLSPCYTGQPPGGKDGADGQ